MSSRSRSGLRQGELLGLRWQDLDLEAGTLSVRHTLQQHTLALAIPKTERSRRTLALDETTVEALRSHRLRQLEERLAAGPRWNDGGFVFPTSVGTPTHHRNLVRAYHAALERAGIPRQPFHQLRHACATLLLESGEELANISKLLGHSSLATAADFYDAPIVVKWPIPASELRGVRGGDSPRPPGRRSA